MRRKLFAVLVAWIAVSAHRHAQSQNTGHDFMINVEYASVDQNGFAKQPIWTFQRINSDADPPFPKPMDLCDKFTVSNSDDPNNPPLSLGNPPCTNQTYSIDYPYGGHDFICVNFGGNSGSLHGHVNWIPAVYAGILYWGSLKPWYKLGDGDFNFALVPDNRAGITYDNFSRLLKKLCSRLNSCPRWITNDREEVRSVNRLPALSVSQSGGHTSPATYVG